MKAKFSAPPAPFDILRLENQLQRLPFTVAVDQREKAPYSFLGMRADSAAGGGLIDVPLEWTHLATGDYSIVGLDDQVAVERKSLEDLYATLGQHRERFMREHERMAGLKAPLVVIEASWHQILVNPPNSSHLLAKTVHRTALAWQMRYRVPWFAAGSRRLAEITTLRFLERYWRDIEKYQA